MHSQYSGFSLQQQQIDAASTRSVTVVFPGLFAGQGGFKMSRVGSGRVKKFQNLAGQVGSGQVFFKSHASGRVGSKGFEISRVGSGRVKRF